MMVEKDTVHRMGQHGGFCCKAAYLLVNGYDLSLHSPHASFGLFYFFSKLFSSSQILSSAPSILLLQSSASFSLAIVTFSSRIQFVFFKKNLQFFVKFFNLIFIVLIKQKVILKSFVSYSHI